MPATLTCLCPFGAPGQMREVLPHGTCPNFRPKPQPPRRVEPPEPTIPGTALIPLTKGLHALVDAADAEWLSKYKWHALVTENGVYAGRCEGYKTILMHRETMQPPEMQVDHKERDSLDNRRENLRICTPEEDCHNTRCRGAVSGFKGVSPHGDKWQARIYHHGESLHVGLYDDPVEAAQVRDRKALELQGPFAYLNFPEIRDEMKTEDAERETGEGRKGRTQEGTTLTGEEDSEPAEGPPAAQPDGSSPGNRRYVREHLFSGFIGRIYPLVLAASRRVRAGGTDDSALFMGRLRDAAFCTVWD